jgi:serine/threonine-protein kinase
MGAVHRAEDLQGRRVAVKVLLPGPAADEELQARFVREAETYRKLDHPGVARYVGSGIEEGVFYLAIELIEGETLGERLQARPGGLGVAAALKLLRDLADVLAAAHSLGIVHRDLKPANVLFDRQEQTKLIDFGLALADDGLVRTAHGTRMGTYVYAAPEQNEGKRVDHTADLFSLGVLGYQALTGALPHKGEKMLTVMIEQMTERYAPPTELMPELPAKVDELFAGLLRADPAERTASAHQVVAQLDLLRRAAPG